MVLIEPAGAEHFTRLAALFDACACACHCRYWHFSGTKNDWLARCALSPEENKSELQVALANRDDTARGLVAIDSTAENKPIVGWMKLAPRASLEKLRRLPVYRSLDLGLVNHKARAPEGRAGDDANVFSIGCFLVHPDFRNRGVARALIEAAPEIVRAWGGNAIEAYPHAVDRPMHDEEVWMGPLAIFERAGFAVVAGEMPYPVMRMILPPPRALGD